MKKVKFDKQLFIAKVKYLISTDIFEYLNSKRSWASEIDGDIVEFPDDVDSVMHKGYEVRLSWCKPINTVTSQEIENIMNKGTIEVSKIGAKTTMVHFTSKEGFEIIETSACVSPDNYDENIGKDICLNKIRDKLWAFEGYCLQKELYKESHENES